ncbi:MAG: TIGR03768 family metallophosphoesterase [Oryzomonas sp.]|jgi:metallophosphoesterase (TIGR03768 family)
MNKNSTILNQDDLNMIQNPNELQLVRGISRRKFLTYTGGAIVCVSLGPLIAGCGGNNQSTIQQYPIDPTAATTLQRMISFPITMGAVTTNLLSTPPPSPNGSPGLAATQLNQVAQYNALGYGAWSFGSPLPMVQRPDIMPSGYVNPTPTRLTKFLNFFSFSDIHITDKEAPNQMIFTQQNDVKYGANMSSLYSPIMPYTTHVLDAAIQTVNALHAKNPFDFGISLGDTCNNTSYNELRWYLDVIDGKVITPSSGAHLGAGTIDYQRPYKAAGLNPAIPWYQTIGNHDHFFLGSFPVDANPSLGLRESYLSGNVWATGDILVPNLTTFMKTGLPALFSMANFQTTPLTYAGIIDGTSQNGAIINAGPLGQFTTAPIVAADPNRRSLVRSDWVQEFFNTTTLPAGHGLNLVDPTQVDGFACYSFLPKSNIPIKVIVLDDTQSETDGSSDIHGHGYLDANRWAWLQAELAAGQAANQLMIIAAHVPIGVAAIASEMEWWLGEPTTTAQNQNAVTLAGLVQTLWNTPNLIMWMSGHRHVNTVKAFPSPNQATNPEQSFWQVETSSLRDYPQQFRTFEIFLNSDYTVSIITTNVDPSVAEGTPAATSRIYAIATQQIIQNNPLVNSPNVAKASGVIPVPSMDPSRPQDGTTDPTIQFTDLSAAPIPVPLNSSCNVELFKQLSPTMIAALQVKFPPPAGLNNM